MTVYIYLSLDTNQLYEDGRTGGQPRVHGRVVVHEQLVRSSPYADDEGGCDEHMEEHVEHGERSVRPRGVYAVPRWRPARQLDLLQL